MRLIGDCSQDFEILSDRFQVVVGCLQVALRFLSGCSEVALGVRERCCATFTLTLSKAGLRLRSRCSRIKGCSDVALGLL